MGLDQAIDIAAGQCKTVLALLERYLPNTTAWVYGSRAKWAARPQSDLDLVVFATPEQNGQVGELREAFEESNLPFRVDLFVWDTVPEQFRKHIKRDHVVLVEREEREVAGEWSRNRFEQILVESVRNGIYKKKEFHGRGVKIVNMGELFAHSRLRAVPMRRVEISESEAERFLIATGDLLFARRSLVAEGAGKCCAVLEVDEPTTFESSIIRARPDKTKTDFLYLYYFFNSLSGLHQLDTIRRQVAVAGITGRDLANLEIPVPPLSEQRAIAHILGTLDDKIEVNRRMNETLEAMARALFKSWFVDFDPVRAKMAGRDSGLPKHIADLFPDRLVDSELGEIPEGWEVKVLAECTDLTMGQSPPGSTYNGHGEGLPFFQGRSDFGFRYPSNRRFCTAPNRIAQPGDTLVSVRAPVGDINLAWDRCCIGRGVAALRHKSGSMSFTYYSTRTIQMTLREYEHTGTVFGAINKSQFEALKVIEPDPSIVDAFDSCARPLDARIKSNTRESLSLTALRDALLPRLVSGKLRVKDTERIVEIA